MLPKPAGELDNMLVSTPVLTMKCQMTRDEGDNFFPFRLNLQAGAAVVFCITVPSMQCACTNVQVSRSVACATWHSLGVHPTKERFVNLLPQGNKAAKWRFFALAACSSLASELCVAPLAIPALGCGLAIFIFCRYKYTLGVEAFQARCCRQSAWAHTATGPKAATDATAGRDELTASQQVMFVSSPSAASLTDFLLSAAGPASGAVAVPPAAEGAPAPAAAPSMSSSSSSSTSSFVLSSTTIGRLTIHRTWRQLTHTLVMQGIVQEHTSLVTR